MSGIHWVRLNYHHGASETAIFVYSAGKLVAEYSNTQVPVTNPTTRYLTEDHLGTPRVVTDSQGNVISRRDFLPFGEQLDPDVGGRSSVTAYQPTNDNVKQKFTGYQKDEESGLDFAEARMYENRHGRFTAVDPLLASGKSANPQTFNRFVYCVNTPLACTDPTGLIGDWYQSTETTTTRTKTGETHTHSLTTYTEFNEDPGGTWTRVDFGASAYLVLGTDLGTEYIYRSGGNDFGERARDIAAGMLACVPAYQCAGLGDPSTRAAQQQAMSEFGTGFVMGVRNELRASVDIPNRNFGPALLPIVGSRALTLDLRPIHFGVSPWFDYETPEGPNQIVGEFTGRFATSTAITAGVGGASNAAVRGISALRAFQSGGSTFAERLFNSKVFGKDSYLFGNKHFSATRTPGLLNAPKSRFKVGWSNTSTEIGFIWPKNIRLFGDGGHQFRFGFGASGNQAFKHLYVPRTYVPNSFANPLMFP